MDQLSKWWYDRNSEFFRREGVSEPLIRRMAERWAEYTRENSPEWSKSIVVRPYLPEV